MAKVIVINGSPRTDQCTATALEEMIKTSMKRASRLSLSTSETRASGDAQHADTALLTTDAFSMT